MRILCLNCHARYSELGDAGEPHYHVCPLVVNRIVQRAGDRLDIGAAEPEPSDITMKAYEVESPGHRDEHPIDDGHGGRVVAQEGAGVIVADDDATLDDILQRRAEEEPRASRRHNRRRHAQDG